MWETPIVPLLQIWKRCGHRGPPHSVYLAVLVATMLPPEVALVLSLSVFVDCAVSQGLPPPTLTEDPKGPGTWRCLVSSRLSQATASVWELKKTQFAGASENHFLSCHCPGLEKRTRAPWGTPWRTRCQSLERVGVAARLSIVSTDYLGYFWASSSFACFGRFVDLGFICRAFGLGLILGFVWAPWGSASHGKRMGGGWAFLLYSVEGCSFVFGFPFSPSISQVISFGFHCVDFACVALAGGIWGWVSPGPVSAKQRNCPSGSCPASVGQKTLPRREEGVVRSQTFGGRQRPSCQAAAILCSPPGAGPKALQRTVEKQLWPPLWVEGTPAGPPGSDWSRHHQPLLWPAGNATVARKEGGPLCLEPVWSSWGQCPSEEKSKRVTFPAGLLSTLGCFSVVDISRKKPRQLLQGLTLCWEWTSARAFDFRQIRLHSHRMSCQNHQTKGCCFLRRREALPSPAPPSRPSPSRPTLQGPRGLAWDPQALVPRHTLILAAVANCLRSLSRGPW